MKSWQLFSVREYHRLLAMMRCAGGDIRVG